MLKSEKELEMPKNDYGWNIAQDLRNTKNELKETKDCDCEKDDLKPHAPRPFSIYKGKSLLTMKNYIFIEIQENYKILLHKCTSVSPYIDDKRPNPILTMILNIIRSLNTLNSISII